MHQCREVVPYGMDVVDEFFLEVGALRVRTAKLHVQARRITLN